MEILLLLALAGLTAGVGLWAARGKRTGEAPPPPFSGIEGGGAKSSPGLPGTGAGERGSEGERGRPVVLARETAERLKEVLDQAPASVQARVAESTGKKGPQKGDKPLKVTYSTDQIIGRASRYAHHRRALTNADTLVEKQKAEQALEVFERIKNRIPDQEIRGKIETNIEDIRRWLEGLGHESDDSLSFPEIIIPLTTQAIAIEGLTEGIKAISQGLVSQLAQAYAMLAGTLPTMPDMKLPPGTPLQPIQILPVMIPAPGSAPLAGPGPASPPQAFAAPSMPPAARPSPSGLKITTDPAGMGEAVPVDHGKQAEDDSWLPDGLQVDENGNVVTDGWTDRDFEREWEKYKNLPPTDRRSGLDRRASFERRTGPDALRKDRRSGIERRKKDLFKEREDFLKKLEEHKRNKEALEAAKKQKPAEEPQKSDLKKHDLPEIFIEHAIVKIGELGKEDEEEEAEKPAAAEKEVEKEAEKEEVADKAPAAEALPPPDFGLNKLAFPSALDRDIEQVVTVAEAPGAIAGAPAAEAEAAPVEGAAAESGLSEGVEEIIEPDEVEDDKKEPEKPAVQEIHGILELKPPEEDDAPFLTLTYDFTKIPNSFKLSRDYHTMEYAYYKYKPMLVKAQEFTRRKMLKNALNYYRVIKSQNIPPEFKRMVNRNIKDITDYLEKFLMRRG